MIHVLQRNNLIVLHTTSGQLYLITLTIQLDINLLGVRRPHHALIDAQKQGDNNGYTPVCEFSHLLAGLR